jgi:hypothetical protein
MGERLTDWVVKMLLVPASGSKIIYDTEVSDSRCGSRRQAPGHSSYVTASAAGGGCLRSAASQTGRQPQRGKRRRC